MPGQVISRRRAATYRDEQPFTPRGNLESPVNLMCMSLDYGRKQENPERTQREHANSTQEGPTRAEYQTQDPLDVRQKDLNSNPGLSCCEQQCLPLSHHAVVVK